MTFDYNSNITDLWGAELVSQSANKVTVKHPSWDLNLAPGEKITIGFIASSGTDKEAPINYLLN